VPNTEKALGALALASNGTQTHHSPKLAPIDWDPGQLLYLAVSYCFDLQRKFEHISWALQEFAEFADGDFAKRLKEEDEQLSKHGLTWRERAQLAEYFLRRAYEDVAEGHEAALERRAASATGEPRSPWPPTPPDQPGQTMRR